MKYIYAILVTFILYGCSGQQMADNITKAQIATSGNKPPAFFRIENVYTMNHYVFNMEDYTISLPSAKQEDFSVFGGWQGLTHYNKDITLYLGTKELGYPYHIVVSTSGNVLKYGEREKAIEAGNVKYIRSKIKIDNDDKLFIGNFGKEKYKCTVMEYTRKNYPQNQYIGYNCYKFNEDNSLYKKVHIRITYTKSPNLPKKYQHLAKEYTYEDLQKRAKRMLDSLYIKDDWDE